MKKILPLLLVLFMTGCTVDYNITIKKSSIRENIKITEDLDKVNERISDQTIENTYSEFNNNLKRKYDSSKTKNDKTITYNLSQTYTIADKLYIRAFSECFDSYIIDTSDENEYIIKTSNGFKCLSYNYNDIDTVNVNITLDQKVIDSNADSVKNKTYTWKIDNTNFSDKSIYIKFKNESKKHKTDIINNNFNIDILYIVLIASGVLVLFSIVVVIVLSINQKKNKL